LKETILNPIVIATRESRLALWQADHVKAHLNSRGFDADLLGMTTSGDEILEQTLSKSGGKSLFIKELEAALATGRADIAVHSLKDVPVELPAGFSLACVTRREDPREAFVSNRFSTFDQLPVGALVGTSSLRRKVLLNALRPDLYIVPLRGNIETRLRKLDAGEYDAIVIAAVGLQRLGLKARIREIFSVEKMIPAAGQGALGIEVRSDRSELTELLQPLNDMATLISTTAERAVTREFGGNCSIPLAAFAEWSGHKLRLTAAWGDPENSSTKLVRAHGEVDAPTIQMARELGVEVAARLQKGGARLLNL
jgi:hydroxymethylbilane synthase